MVMHPGDLSELGCIGKQLEAANCATMAGCEGAHSAEYTKMLRGTQVRVYFWTKLPGLTYSSK